MKSVSKIKSSNTSDSPKTPGGISKSLLTPCRRLGLSRNFRKSGASPFQSPLSSSTEVKQENVEPKKRKEPLEDTPKTENDDCECEVPSVTQTPTRNVALPSRKRSKTLLASINKSAEQNEHRHQKDNASNDVSSKEVSCENAHTGNLQKVPDTEVLSTPVRLKCKSRSKRKISPSNVVLKEATTKDVEKENSCNNQISVAKTERFEESNEFKEIKENSPNNLTKECIVVLQKKIFKKELKEKQKAPKIHEEVIQTLELKNTVSQVVFDSDSDDVPLICLNNKEVENKASSSKCPENDDDFASSHIKLKKADITKALKLKVKSPTGTKNKHSKVVNVKVHKPHDSQSSADDDDFFEKKKTILIRKNYDKVAKPQKAKSTGSITQKDIDDLKARIEVKKKMLLARGMTEDTKELRDLIKKWQKGCQDALMELMDLMKYKIPDKQNMDYSEILQTLKIPASLVGYDSDNDCFVTPNDESIILANVKD